MTRLRVTVVTLIAAIACGGWFWFGKREDVETSKLLRRGTEAASAGKFDDAARTLEQYVEAVPNDVDGLRKYADVLRELDGSPAVLERLFAVQDLILRREPNDTETRRNQAILALDMDRFPAAASLVDSLESRQPLDAELWCVRAECLAASVDDDKAMVACKQALELDPACWRAARLRSALFEQKNDPDAAAELLAEFSRRTGNTDAVLAVAELAQRQGDADLAIKTLATAARRAPDNARIVIALADVTHTRLSQGEFPAGLRERTVDAVSVCLDANPSDPNVRLGLAKLLWLEPTDRDQAVEVLTVGTQLDDDSQPLKFALADALVSVGRLEDAVSVVKSFGSNENATRQRVWIQSRIHAARNQHQKALGVLERLLEKPSADPSLRQRARRLRVACLSHIQVAGADEAREAFRRSRGLTVDSRLQLAESSLRANDAAGAISDYRRLKGVRGVSPLLADLLIEQRAARTTSTADDWREVERLLGTGTNAVTNPAERAILKADMWLARGDTANAWRVLTGAFADQPANAELKIAIEQVTSLLLDRTASSLLTARESAQAGMTFRLVVSHWAKRADVGRLVTYCQQFASQPENQNDVHRRMFVAAVFAHEIGEAVRRKDQGAAAAQGLATFAEQQLSTLGSQAKQTLPLRAQFLAATRRFDEAVELIQESKSPLSVSGAVCAICPFGYSDEQRLLQLQAVVTKQLERDPESADLAHAAAVVLSARGEHAAAIAQWESVLVRSPSHAASRIWLAREIAVFRNDASRSSGLLDGVAESEPHLVDAKACVLIARGDFAEAETLLQQAIAGSPSLSALTHLAYAQRAAGSLGAARVSLRRLQRSGVNVAFLHPLDRAIFDRLSGGIESGSASPEPATAGPDRVAK